MKENNYNFIFVPIEQFNDYFNNEKFPKECLVSVCGNIGEKSNYKKFVKIIKKALKYLPKEIEIELKAVKQKKRKEDIENDSKNQ